MKKHPLTYVVTGKNRDGSEWSYESYMHQHHVKKALGLPKKLPFRAFDGRFKYVGCINGISIWDYGQKPGRRCHRLYALIKDRYVPCGRLHQYKD